MKTIKEYEFLIWISLVIIFTIIAVATDTDFTFIFACTALIMSRIAMITKQIEIKEDENK